MAGVTTFTARRALSIANIASITPAMIMIPATRTAMAATIATAPTASVSVTVACATTATTHHAVFPPGHLANINAFRCEPYHYNLLTEALSLLLMMSSCMHVCGRGPAAAGFEINMKRVVAGSSPSSL